MNKITNPNDILHHQTTASIKQSMITVPNQCSKAFTFNQELDHSHLSLNNHNYNHTDGTQLCDRETEPQIPTSYEKLLILCQNMRKQIRRLKKSNRDLQAKVIGYEKGEEQTQSRWLERSCSLNYSPSISNQNRNRQNICDKVSILTEQYSKYKQSIYSQYKKKLKQIQLAFNYLLFCYAQSMEAPLLNPKLSKTMTQFLDPHHQNCNKNLIGKLKALYQSKSEFLEGNLDFQHDLWSIIDQKQSKKLRIKINQLKQILNCVLKDQKMKIKGMRQQIRQNNEKISHQLIKCMKKYLKCDFEQIKSQKQIKSSLATPSIPLGPRSKINEDGMKGSSMTPKNRSFCRKNSNSFSKISSKKDSSTKELRRKSIKS